LLQTLLYSKNSKGNKIQLIVIVKFVFAAHRLT
jgi:hypothetical protein